MQVNETLRGAVGLALTAGATAALAPAGAALAQQPPGESSAGTDTLGEVTVTGSRIRRIDAETASPVFVIDQSTIAQSGTTTIGDLVQRIPAIAGAATNPQVNNGGGFGESNVELRGLNAKRTLILLNGRRVGLVGASGAVDVNMIPVSIVERVEVLKEGAGAVYGSDAVAGVVNFITRKDVQGFEVGADYGRTAESDGTHYSANVLWGMTGENFNALVGGSYMKQEKVSANNRDFSKFALYLYSGAVSQAGSSRIPTGRVFLPSVGPIRNQFGCGSVTRKTGTAGNSLNDYRCYNGGSDAYNYQPFNLLMTPQERAAAFTTLNYKFNEYVESYAEFLFNSTHSGYQIAPLPFDAVSDDVVVSKDSIYNVFGYDMGGFNTPNPNMRVRLESLGNRFSEADSDSKLSTLGFKGKIGESTWTWDANMQYSRLDQRNKVNGYFYIPGLQAAVGPSYRDSSGTPKCGTPTATIPNCTPINIFNVQDPTQIANLRAVTTGYSTNNTYISSGGSLNFAGDLFQMPAGAASTAVGVEYRKQEGNFSADYLVQAKPPLYTNCLLSSEACTGNTRGEYKDTEIYAEVFLPLLKDMTGAQALNLTIGGRYSNYDLFDSTTKGQFKVEYRPIHDVLIRGTYSQVFRVPTITDLYGAPAISNPTFADPCLRLTAAKIASNPNYSLACKNVPIAPDPRAPFTGDGTSQITSVITSNTALKPETGDVMTAGIVFSPSALEGFQISLDYWKYKIKDLISNIDTNYSINQCLNNGTQFYCNLVTRISGGPGAGRIAAFIQPTVNLGELNVNGVDLGVKYTLNDTPIGSFRFGVDVTRFNKYENQAAPDVPPVDYVGLYDKQFGNIAEIRGTFTTGWVWNNVDALLAIRYIDGVKILNADGANPFDSPALNINSIWYTDLTVGYTFPTKTKLQLGAINLTNKQPPLFYQNNVINANTDVSTYDTLGRRYFISVNQKF